MSMTHSRMKVNYQKPPSVPCIVWNALVSQWFQ